MLTLLEAMGEATVGDLAASIGKPADRLYHHIHVLESAGLVRVAGSRPASRRDETLYALADEAVTMKVGPEDAEGLVKMARAMCRGGFERLEENVRRGLFDGQRAQFRSEEAWLTDDEVLEAAGLMLEARRVFDRARARGRPKDSIAARCSLIMMLTHDGPRAPADGGDGCDRD